MLTFKAQDDSASKAADEPIICTITIQEANAQREKILSTDADFQKLISDIQYNIPETDADKYSYAAVPHMRSLRTVAIRRLQLTFARLKEECFDETASHKLYDAFQKTEKSFMNLDALLPFLTFSEKLARLFITKQQNIGMRQKWFYDNMMQLTDVELRPFFIKFAAKMNCKGYSPLIKFFDFLKKLTPEKKHVTISFDLLCALNAILENIDSDKQENFYLLLQKSYFTHITQLTVEGRKIRDVLDEDDPQMVVKSRYEKQYFNHGCEYLEENHQNALLSLLKMQKHQLTILCISGFSGFDETFAQKMLVHLKKMPRLHSLTLTDLNIGFTVLNTLNPYLKSCTTLRSFNLSFNPIEEAALSILNEVFAENAYITELYLEKILVIGANAEQEKQKRCVTQALKTFVTKLTKENHAIIECKVSSACIALSNALDTTLDKLRTQNVALRAKLLTYASNDDVDGIKAVMKQGTSPYHTNPEDQDTIFHIAARKKLPHTLRYLLSLKELNHFIPNQDGITFASLLEANPDLQQTAEKKKLPAQQETPPEKSMKVASAHPSSKTAPSGAKKRPQSDDTGSQQLMRDFLKKPKPQKSQAGPADESLSPIPIASSRMLDAAPQPMEVQEAISGLEQIYHAIIFGSLEAIESLSSDELLNIHFADGKNLLHLSIIHQHKAITFLLLEKIPQLANEKDMLGYLPLHYACQSADIAQDTLKLFKALIDVTKSIHDPNCFRVSSLYLLLAYIKTKSVSSFSPADYKILYQIIGYLLKTVLSDSDFEVYDPHTGKKTTLLHLALHAGEKIFKLFWRKYPHLHLTDFEQNTALHFCIKHKFAASAERILSTKQIDINGKNMHGKLAEEYLKEMLYPEAREQVSRAFAKRKKNMSFLNFPQSSLFHVKKLRLSLALSKPNEIIDDSNHESLQKDHELYQKTTEGNIVIFELKIYVKNRTEPFCWKPPADYRLHFTAGIRAEDAKKTVIDRYLAGNSELKTQYIEGAKPLTEKEIHALTDSEFKRKFHHSEQGMLNFLEDTKQLQKILTELKEKYPEFRSPLTVSAVILDLHSTRPCCANCTIGLLGSLNSKADLFAGKLKNLFLTEGFLLPENRSLPFIARVSSKSHERTVVSFDQDDDDDQADEAPQVFESLPLYVKELTQPVLLSAKVPALAQPAVGLSRNPQWRP